MSKTREQFPLSERKIWKKTISGTFVFSILLLLVWIFIGVITNTEDPSLGISTDDIFKIATISIFIFWFIIFYLVYLYQKWYFSTYFYDFTEDFIIIKKGPITPQEITIPYERIQDVYVDQDLLDRIFGIYDVHLSSATISSGMAAHIDGVEKISADGLKEVLLKTVQSKITRSRQVYNNHSNN